MAQRFGFLVTNKPIKYEGARPLNAQFQCKQGQDDLCEAFFAYNRAKGTLYDGETRLFFRSSGNMLGFITFIVCKLFVTI